MQSYLFIIHDIPRNMPVLLSRFVWMQTAKKLAPPATGFRHKFCICLFTSPDRYSDHPADKQYIGKMKKKEGVFIAFSRWRAGQKHLSGCRGVLNPQPGPLAGYPASGCKYIEK